MPGKNVYEYAFIRLVPKVEREEFLNVGVILFCKSLGYLDMRYHLPEARLKAFSEEIDIKEVKAYLEAWEKICEGKPNGGPIAELDKASRFRWLTAVRSTIIQSSKVHPGLCEQPQGVLEGLFARYVE